MNNFLFSISHYTHVDVIMLHEIIFMVVISIVEIFKRALKCMHEDDIKKWRRPADNYILYFLGLKLYRQS